MVTNSKSTEKVAFIATASDLDFVARKLRELARELDAAALAKKEGGYWFGFSKCIAEAHRCRKIAEAIAQVLEPGIG